MSKFGWSLPAGCTTLPGEEPDHPTVELAERLAEKYPDLEWLSDWPEDVEAVLMAFWQDGYDTAASQAYEATLPATELE